MVFLVTFHTLLYFAGTAGYLPAQSQSAHKTFVDQFRDNQNLTDTAQVNTEADVITETLGPFTYVTDAISLISGILLSPYGLLVNSGIPLMFKWIMGAALSILEVSAVLSYVRGFDL